ncbi:tryptophan 7-halogenase [Micromonospora sp. WMMA1998]|uniref:NAD(P)/FAD-dependent oxidoreductase n=1 Tax=Micromonospora sp. WMMA1998 TaxID=3015167 RepID=UPI00248C0392|nr:FAD-dependent monooxygenase [Micromonospora sp. WMMA1998]WBC14937.1 tryptophan 7-halogenase [Micromonospora sp. WMMA1998]
MAGNESVTSAHYDLAIVGGGAAGLTLALQVRNARPDTRVVVIERQRHPVPTITHKVGESTVEIAGFYLREVLGLGDHLRQEQLNKFGLRVFFSSNGNHDITRRVELGHAVCPPYGVGTYQIDRGRLENALGRRLAGDGVDLRTGRRVVDITLGSGDQPHRLRLDDGEGSAGAEELTAAWVVDATGRSSVLKRQLGLARKTAHRANAVWFRIAHPIDINDWSDDPQWRARIREGRRELSTNHLMGDGYWVWLIRLASDAISIGIVTDDDSHRFDEMNRFERALDWLRVHEPQCAAVVERHRDKVQDFRVMKDYSYGCEQVFSDQRWCLAGEAGVFLDPFYSPGLDLIAISNGLITDLVTRALDGEDVEDLAAIHNQVFLLIANGWLRIYEHQYPLMGNARIMLAKIIWDTAVYWAVPGLLFFHDTVRRLADFPQIVTDLARFTGTSELIQRFFREWHAIERSVHADRFVGFYDFDFMRELHVGMTAGLDDADLATTFGANVDFIEQISGQMVAAVMDECRARASGGQVAGGDAGDAEAVAAQLAAWESDDGLRELVERYRERHRHNPVSGEWFNLPGVDRRATTEEPAWVR